jgi:hypothetical protein
MEVLTPFTQYLQELEPMQTKNVIEIVTLCHRLAPCCLGLMEHPLERTLLRTRQLSIF